ncbi:ABC transporter ATP-binding protein [Streptomyces solisilvae]|uniref:ABC transporter ATP-binding protein n=1 Tax=Streptomyces malaysiensis TaxID=92644 RepID=UPI0036B2C979
MRGGIQMIRQLFTMAAQADRTVTLLVLLLSATQAVAVAGISQSQRWVVDAAGSDQASGLVAAVALGAFAHTAMASLGRIHGNLTNDLSDRIAFSLSQEVLSTTASIPGIEHLERPDYLDRLALVRKGARGLAAFGWALVQTATSVVSLGLSVWLLWDVHPALTLLAPFTLVWMWLGYRGQRYLHQAEEESAEAVRLELQLHELCLTAQHAKELYISGSGPEISRQADELWEQTARADAHARLRSTALQSAGWLFFSLGLASALTVASRLVIEHRASPGDVVLVVSLALQLRQQLNLTIQSLEQVASAARVTDQYLWLRKYAGTSARGGVSPPHRLHDGISLHDVSFHYPGTDVPALHEINLHFPAGSTVGIVGVNGAGKTTLIKLLTGMYQPSKGTIHADGLPLASMDPYAWAKGATGAFQDFTKFQLTAQESVGVGNLPLVDDPAAVRDAMHHAGADSLLNRLPNGLNTWLGRAFDGTELSQGQWQRLAVARAFMRHKPVVLILDEPTASLDPQTEHELFERFAAEAARTSHLTGAVTFLVSHRFSTVRMADHIVVLANGAVAEQGTHYALIRAGGEYARLYTAQARGYILTEASINDGSAGQEETQSE